MTGRVAAKAAKGIVGIALLSTLVGFIVKGLWNALVPSIFGLHPITFWQALGLAVLSKILFGGFHPHGNGGRWKRRMRERLAEMTPEERERLRQGMSCRGMGFRAATADTHTQTR